MHSPEGGALEGVSLRVFPNLRRTHGTSPYVNNSLFIAFASFLFGRKEIFPWEHGNTYQQRLMAQLEISRLILIFWRVFLLLALPTNARILCLSESQEYLKLF